MFISVRPFLPFCLICVAAEAVQKLYLTWLFLSSPRIPSSVILLDSLTQLTLLYLMLQLKNESILFLINMSLSQ